ncbi:hypothetical protein [Desulfosarcina variabilis]|uniref:hypothetical protein n=1 Tax=Desulfosarcina variabilis TaxID=2300 RepID=UPI003AFB3C56
MDIHKHVTVGLFKHHFYSYGGSLRIVNAVILILNVTGFDFGNICFLRKQPEAGKSGSSLCLTQWLSCFDLQSFRMRFR